MSYLVLARKRRPQTFDEVVGQDHITRTLQNAIRSGRIAHALLFSGPRGVGKTSMARIVAKAMNCDHGTTPTPCNTCQSCKEITRGVSVDVLEVDGASNRGIEAIRELRENVKYSPSRSRFKVYIVDEVHMLTTEAFNALLKTLEEPPRHVLFILATTEQSKIPVTILSRCQKHEFRRIGTPAIEEQLRRICVESGFKISDGSVQTIASQATGGMRDALSLLDQVMAYADGAATDDDVAECLGVASLKAIHSLASALLGRESVAAIVQLEELYSRGQDLKRLYSQLMEYFRNLLILSIGGQARELVDASLSDIEQMQTLIKDQSMPSIHQVFTTLFEAETTIKLSGQPKLALEALFVKAACLVPVVPMEQLVERLEALASGAQPAHVGVSADSSSGAPLKPSQPPLLQAKPEPHPVVSLEHAWERLKAVLGKEVIGIKSILDMATLTQLGTNRIQISVRGSGFFVSRLRDEKSIKAIQHACQRLFGLALKTVEIVEAEQQPSEIKGAASFDNTNELKRQALNNPVVSDALEVFQGTIVDVKLR